MKGEHAEGAPDPMVRRALELAGEDRTRHRPHFGVMSTSLLNELMTDHLDGGYAAAAARRQGGESPKRSRVALLVGLLLLGFVLAVAYRGTIRQAPDSERARQALVTDVENGSALSDALQRRAEALSGQLVRERDAALTTSRTGDRVSAEVRRLEEAAAQRPVHGPGISVVAGDAAAAEQVDPATGQRAPAPAEDNGQLRDRDLQGLVNALWAAGAEAVSVGGERLAPTTTIRAAGEAILVDLRPVQSPYTIEAVGDPATLLPRFADSDAARRFQSWTGLYGIQFTVREAGDLRLRAATGPDLRYASEVPSPTPPTPTPPGSVPSGSATPRPGSSAPASSGPAPSRSAPSGSATPSASGPSRSGPSRFGPSVAVPSRSAPSGSGTPSASGRSRLGLVKFGPVGVGPVGVGPVVVGPVVVGPVVVGPGGTGPVVVGPVVVGPAGTGVVAPVGVGVRTAQSAGPVGTAVLSPVGVGGRTAEAVGAGLRDAAAAVVGFGVGTGAVGRSGASPSVRPSGPGGPVPSGGGR